MNHLQRAVALLTACVLILLAFNAPWSVRSGSGSNSGSDIVLAPIWQPPSVQRWQHLSLHYWSLLAQAALVVLTGATLIYALKSPPGSHRFLAPIELQSTFDLLARTLGIGLAIGGTLAAFHFIAVLGDVWIASQQDPAMTDPDTWHAETNAPPSIPKEYSQPR